MANIRCTFTFNTGELSAGTHNIVIGGWNNKKTTSNEITWIYFDNVSLTDANAKSGQKSVLNTIDDDRSINIFPNPITGNQLTLELKGYEDTSGLIGIHDLSGRIIHTDKFISGSNLTKHYISLPNLSRGMYLVSVSFGSKKVIKKLIVK